MSDDIVTRLRGLACRVCAAEPCMAHREAADEIERLRTAFTIAKNQLGNARRLSDITTPICPTCGGSRLCDYLDSRLIGRPMFPCPDCIDGRIPPKVWVGMLTDALRGAQMALHNISCDTGEPSVVVACDATIDNLSPVLALADSVTPKENE